MYDLGEIAQSVATKLKERRETVAVTESSAGGIISAALLSIPGASAYFIAGGVIYTPDARHKLLQIPPKKMVGLRSSSEPYAQLLATHMQEVLGTTWTVSETGASGPAGNRYGDSPGHTCVAVQGPIKRAMTLETGEDDRITNMWIFARTALELLEECVDTVGQ